MDFDSPDVAKEFPGLYYEDSESIGGKGGKSTMSSINDANDYDDDSDKSSKKKKDKKDSKKDKGYAALAGESSPDEDEHPAGSKSPGRVKKLKAFKLTSSLKKHKETTAEASSKAPITAESSKKEKKLSLTSIEKDLKKVIEKERKLSSESKPSKSEKALLGLVVRKHSIPGFSGAAPADEVTPKKSSRHPLPFSPTAAASAKQEQPVKKEPIASAVKARLKLKRGSKHSMEETQNPEQSPVQSQGRQLPEDPESLAKEIKKYEALLEQSHSQIKTSKKVSKKHEEQLWELQRTLTQLKRKLRSINALSCASIITNNAIFNPPLASTSQHAEIFPVDQQPQRATIEPKAQVELKSLADNKKLEQSLDIELIPESVEEIEQNHAATNAKLEIVKKPELPIPETIQVHVQVHNQDAKQVLLPVTGPGTITEDLQRSNSNEVPDQPLVSQRKHSSTILEERRSSSPSGRVVLETVQALSSIDQTSHQGPSPASQGTSTQQTQSNGMLVDKQNNITAKQEAAVTDTVDGGDYVEISCRKNSLTLNRLTSFNPFTLPIFQTDEFIALENEAFLMFNQALQDQIIEEESIVEKLVKQIGSMIDTNHGLLFGVSIEDLDELENDELVSTLEAVKQENDLLHDQVTDLKSRVARAKLEEFQLELRLKYLQEHELLEVEVAEAIK